MLTVCDHGYVPQPLISVDTTSRLRVPVGLPHDNYPGGPDQWNSPARRFERTRLKATGQDAGVPVSTLPV